MTKPVLSVANSSDSKPHESIKAIRAARLAARSNTSEALPAPNISGGGKVGQQTTQFLAWE